MDGNGSASRVQFGTVTLIPDERLLLKDGHPVSLTPKAFDLLVVLAANPGRLLAKEQLMQAVWPDTTVEESNLAYHVFAIRKALGESANSDRYIETVPKRGYRFVAPLRVEADGRAPDLAHDLKLESATGTLERREQTGPLAGGSSDVERKVTFPGTRRTGITLRVWLGLAGALAVAALTLPGLGPFANESVPTEPVRFQEPVSGRLAETGMFSISPDGRRLVYAAEGPDGVLRLWARAMNTLQPVPIPGTEVFTIIPPVVWSPDSRFVAFDPGYVLKKASLDGGTPQSVCQLPGAAVGGSWNRAGEILVGNAAGGLVRCPASGGVATTVTVADLSKEERHIFPSFLSDGRHFIYLRLSRTNPEMSGIYLGVLGADSASVGNRLITTGFGAAFVAGTGGGPGAIVFARDDALFAQRFDERRLALIGAPVRLADGIGSYLDGAFFSVSPKTLVYRAPEPDARLTWFDRRGRELGRVGTPARFSGLALSPNDDRALVTTAAPQGTTNADLWLFDLTRTAIPRRITFGPALEFWPTWSGNDRFVFGSGGGSSGVYQQTISGDRQLVFKTGQPEIPTSTSRDGRILLFTTITGSATGGDVWVRIGASGSGSALPFLRGEHDQSQAQLSPDGRWVAYVSNEAGPNDVFVTELRFDSATASVSAGQTIRISQGGGFSPRWRRDGRELFYRIPDGSVLAVAVDAERTLRLGTATRLFKVPGAIPGWGVTQDGSRFLFAVPVSQPPPFNVVKDWQATLPK
jgi:DNA-binding winged helix-turn-helix (wHTH) protein/Tol biopolymer transport system component